MQKWKEYRHKMFAVCSILRHLFTSFLFFLDYKAIVILVRGEGEAEEEGYKSFFPTMTLNTKHTFSHTLVPSLGWKKKKANHFFSTFCIKMSAPHKLWQWLRLQIWFQWKLWPVHNYEQLSVTIHLWETEQAEKQDFLSTGRNLVSIQIPLKDTLITSY